jgi:hypothetical protein
MALMEEGRVERVGSGEGGGERGVRRHSRLLLVGGSDQGRPLDGRQGCAAEAGGGASFLARRHLI